MSNENLKMDDDCRFCSSNPDRRIIFKGKYCFAFWDLHPASDGHFLVVPHRHFPDYFDIENDERDELWELVAKAKKVCDEKFHPDGYNVGINVGKAAGQSVPHLHVHVIPRYTGDVENPKGGVRGVLPKTKHYELKSK